MCVYMCMYVCEHLCAYIHAICECVCDIEREGRYYVRCYGRHVVGVRPPCVTPSPYQNGGPTMQAEVLPLWPRFKSGLGPLLFLLFLSPCLYCHT